MGHGAPFCCSMLLRALLVLTVAVATMPCGTQAARAPYHRSKFMTAKKSKLAYMQPSAHTIRSVPDVGVLCSQCCISTDKQDVPQLSKAEKIDFKYSAYSVKYDDSIYVWRWEGSSNKSTAGQGLIMKGTTHIVWVLKHNNFLFNLAAALNAWRTWTDMAVRPTRVLLLRPPRPSYEWMYSQLRGFVVSSEDAAAAEPPRTLQGVTCFERAVLGHVKKPVRPFDWTTTCKRQPKTTHEEMRLFQGFASYIQRGLKATTAPIVGNSSRISSGSGSKSPPQCRAVVQLRGSADGPTREPRGRNFLNAAEAAGALAAAGFVVDAVDLRTTQMEEAAKLHGAADVVVAPHGAGVANAVFCRPGTTLVELQSWGAQKWVYERISRALGLGYRPLVCSSPGQCPLMTEGGGEWQQQQHEGEEEQQGPGWGATAPAAMHDLCRRGIRKQQLYTTNHTRDIRVDVSLLQSVALEAASGLEAEGRCRLVLPPPPRVAHDRLLFS